MSKKDNDGWASRLAISTTTKKPIVSLGNLYLIFENDQNWRGVLAMNERTQKIEFRRRPPPDIHAEVGDVLTDEHETQTTVWLQAAWGIPVKSATIIHTAMVGSAILNAFDPVREWLDSLPAWDSVDRLDHWLSDVTGCDNNIYTAAVGRVTLIGAVARVYDPGCKFDTVMILQGPQGSFKSTMLSELVGRDEWFTDHISDIGGKDAALQLCGPWLLEFAELDAITAKRESERVKAWITQRRDRYRPPYGRAVVDVPRRVFFCGTSNLDQFLRDETGGRRFLPVQIKEIDLDALREMREHLWSEAVARYRKGESWWMKGEDLAAAKNAQEDCLISDPWEEKIRIWLNTPGPSGKPNLVTANEVLDDCLKVDISRQEKREQDRVGRILGKLGWKRKVSRINSDSGDPRRCWTRPVDAPGDVTPIKPEAATAPQVPDQKGLGWS
jgi:putative DNA primase/helicase